MVKTRWKCHTFIASNFIKHMKFQLKKSFKNTFVTYQRLNFCALVNGGKSWRLLEDQYCKVVVELPGFYPLLVPKQTNTTFLYRISGTMVQVQEHKADSFAAVRDTETVIWIWEIIKKWRIMKRQLNCYGFCRYLRNLHACVANG